jgi:hypothetical protein
MSGIKRDKPVCPSALREISNSGLMGFVTSCLIKYTEERSVNPGRGLIVASVTTFYALRTST